MTDADASLHPLPDEKFDALMPFCKWLRCRYILELLMRHGAKLRPIRRPVLSNLCPTFSGTRTRVTPKHDGDAWKNFRPIRGSARRCSAVIWIFETSGRVYPLSSGASRLFGAFFTQSSNALRVAFMVSTVRSLKCERGLANASSIASSHPPERSSARSYQMM